jgi:hypothetical protein
MAFATSQDRTVLWDQFEYTGSPEDFSWVLPIRPGAYLEASTDAWFESLESVTQTRVVSPALQCTPPDTSDGCGCPAFGGMDSAESAGGTSDPNGGGMGGVDVIHRGTVGPYETVTLRSTDGDALTTWLGDNGYFIPLDIEPVIAAYVAEGADFVALRLQPGVGVQQMTPVRVVTPGGDAILPLRMVAAGTGESVEIVLYVIGELRFEMPDFTQVAVNAGDLVWDFGTNNSNYLELRRQALARDIGFNYLTTFSNRGAFWESYSTSNGTIFHRVGTQFLTTFADLYFAQARFNDRLPEQPACPSILNLLQSNFLVRAEPAANELDDAAFTCGEYSDISAAMIGMHPSRVWLTRLELDLPREALAMDCLVTASPTQTEISHLPVARRSKNVPNGCDAVPQSRVSFSGPYRTRPNPTRHWLFAVGLGCALLLRKRGTRAR